MPYGLPKNLDTPTNEHWMEECVEGVLSKAKPGSGMDKGRAIAICKTQLIKNKGNQNRANIGVVNEFLERFSERRRKR